MRLTDWLETSPDAERWRVYLDLNAVETLVGRGYRAEAEELRRAAERFQGPHESLRHPNFRSVHELLLQQAERIQRANVAFPESTYQEASLEMWGAAFRQAATELRPMSSAEANRKRQEVLAQFEALRQFLDERGPGEANYVSPPPILATLKGQTDSPAPAEIHAEQLKQVGLLIQWLQVPIVFPWDIGDQNAQPPAVGRIGDDPATLRIGDRVDETGLSEAALSVGSVSPAAWQDETIPSNPTLNDVLAGLRQQQIWLQQNSRLDPNPYVAYPQWLLNDFLTGLNLGRRENLPQLLARQVENLTNGLDQWQVAGDRNRQVEIARVIGLLESVDQASDLTAAFRRTFWRNNAAVFVGESLVNQLASRPVNETQPVYEVILDNEVFGTANTQGQVQIDFVPDASQAHVSLRLTGLVNSDNYTPSGPITAFTGSQAEVEARRSVYANSGGWYQRAPYGAANLHSYFKGTSCGRLVDRLAEGQFRNQQAGAEAIGARRAENRLVRQFEEQTSEALAQGRSELRQRRQQAGVWRAVRPVAYFLTDEHFFQVHAKKFSGAQTLALGAAPAIQVPSDLAVQVHESFLTNFLEDELGGLRLTDEDVARIEAQLRAEAAKSDVAGGQIGDQAAVEREPFELTLANIRPVELRFDAQMVLVVLNVRNFRSQGQSINDAQVVVRLKFERDEADPTNKLRFRQVGEVKASLLDPDKIDLNTATVLDLIETTINREIRRQREDRADQEPGLVLPTNLIDPQLLADLEDSQLRRLAEMARLVVFSFENGWATLAWRVPLTTANLDPAMLDAIGATGTTTDAADDVTAPVQQ
jgi:hypothetical protein